MTRTRMYQISALCVVASFTLTMVAVLGLTQGQAAPEKKPVMAGPVSGTASGVGNLRESNDVRVYRQVKDAVVNITASRLVPALVSSGNQIFDTLRPDLLRQTQAKVQSLGSGFVIHPSGYIITNEHVVESAVEVQCVFFNGDSLPAKVIATDNEHDLAVLKVEPPLPLHALDLGASEDLMIGEPVYAIGNPYGFAGTMTRGIVSAVNRTLEVSQDKTYSGLIQTDASINPGNSGGPLLNAYGQVVGVNSAIRQGATGIGFAISVSNMRDLLPTFLNPEALNQAEVGFTVEEKRSIVPPSEVTSEVVVREVQAGSDAEKAGLKAGDRLLTVRDLKVDNVVDALVDMGGAKGGETLAMTVERQGVRREVKVPVNKLPVLSPAEIILSKMGIESETITPALATERKLPLNAGVYVKRVEPNSPAAKKGMAVGDIVAQLGPYIVRSNDEVAYLLKSVKKPVEGQIVVFRLVPAAGGWVRIVGTIPLK